MPASRQLNTWIAESGSWQSFIDFKLPEDERANYPFLSYYDNFFLSLMSRTIELLKDESKFKNTEELLSVAKGLEIYSLSDKKNYFVGVNHSNNILYSAGLYYLANFSASAWILSKLYKKENYAVDVEFFISSFLRRDLTGENRFNKILSNFLLRGRVVFLRILILQIQRGKKSAFNNDIEVYFSFLLAEVILNKFANDNIWNDLLKINDDPDHWKAYVAYNISKKVPVWSFFPSQKLAIQKGILSGVTCSLQMPTSSGKTSISELIIYDEFKKNANCRILYLAPYRALASELKQTLAVNIGNLGISSKTIYGGNLPTVEERTSISDVNLLIATPEKFMAVEDIFPGISESFTTIICDEGHLLDDESRGLSYELLLSRFKGNTETNKRFIFISAIIPNIAVVNSWLGGSDESLISSDYRPTELEYAFLKKMDRTNGFYLDINPLKARPYNYQLYKFLFTDELEIQNSNGGVKRITSKKGISVAVALKAINSGTVALFAPHKRGNTGVEGLAEEAVTQVNGRPNLSLLSYSPEGHLNNLEEYFTLIFGRNYLLTRCSKLGILFHHGDFPQSIREIIEDSLRHGKIRFVICTNTLAEGVNLPIKTMIIHSTKRFNPFVVGNYESIKIRDLKNLVGRAGRAGKETKGMVIIPHEADFDRIRQLIAERDVEPVKGQLYNIINLITNYLRRKQLQVTTETLDSLSGQLQELLDSIDISIIDLLAEEIAVENLNELVSELIRKTLSFYQANEDEKKTLKTLFELRAEKLKPIVERGEFSILKNSGTNIRLYDAIIAEFDFENVCRQTNLDTC
jgi:superfamily II DNA/RNA helicase